MTGLFLPCGRVFSTSESGIEEGVPSDGGGGSWPCWRRKVAEGGLGIQFENIHQVHGPGRAWGIDLEGGFEGIVVQQGDGDFGFGFGRCFERRLG
jgi:hypothetical protein